MPETNTAPKPVSEEEGLWLRAVSNNPAFRFSKEEELYSITDGKPLDAQTETE